MTFEGIDIDVQYKNVKYIRMVVYPDMRVRVSAPLAASGDDVRRFIEKHQSWLHNALKRKKDCQKEEADKPTLSPLQQLIEDQKRYERLMAYIKPRFEYWRERMSLPSVRFSIRKMTTRWGSCTPKKRTIRFNLALADMSERAIDYIVVHELAHINHHNHGPKFKAALDFYMPDWREREKELK